MVTAGAAGTTRDELLSTLRVDDAGELHDLANALTAELDRRSRRDVTLSVSNSLWVQTGLAIESPFLDTLARHYGTGLQLVDFRTDADGARERINSWVGDETAGRIPELLQPGVLGPDSRLTVVNTVHMKAAWARPFDAERTEEGTFTTSDDDLVRVPMMHMTEVLPYASGDGWQAVELAYTGGDLALLIYQPEEGFLADFEQAFMWDEAVPLPRADGRSASRCRASTSGIRWPSPTCSMRSVCTPRSPPTPTSAASPATSRCRSGT